MFPKGLSFQLHNLIRLTIFAAEVDGFTLEVHTRFTSIDDQAGQISRFIEQHHSGKIACAYGLSLGGKILSRVLERNEVSIDHSILDAAPLLPLPKADISFWYGSKEAFVAVSQVKHLKSLCPEVKVELFDKMNHGQLLVDHPDQVARRIMATGVMDSDQISTAR